MDSKAFILGYLLAKDENRVCGTPKKLHASISNDAVKDAARKVMRSKQIRLRDKVDLYLNISWSQRFRWFPVITLIYFLFWIILVYTLFVVL